jgi:hypothetical protein
LIEFLSAVDALSAAIEFQQAMAQLQSIAARPVGRLRIHHGSRRFGDRAGPPIRMVHEGPSPPCRPNRTPTEAASW